MRLANLTHPELIFPHLAGSDRPTVLRAFADRLAEISPVSDAEDLYLRLCEREDLSSTGIGSGVAIPHCRLKKCDNAIGILMQLNEAIDFDSIDGMPVDLVFTLLVPEEAVSSHLESLQVIATNFNQPDDRKQGS